MSDAVNGSFEFIGSLLLFLNCYRTIQAKQVKGVSIVSTAFFAAWGFWNLFYYPHLDQWLSFSGGVSIVTANTIWIGLMIYYTRKGTANA